MTIICTSGERIKYTLYLIDCVRSTYYDDIYIKTYKDTELVKEEISDRFSRENIFVTTLKAMEENEAAAFDRLFILLKGFSMATMLIGIFGVFNNFIVNFMSRKRELAVFRSVGMDKWQLTKMILIEAFSGGLIGGLLGLGSSYLAVNVLNQLLIALHLPMTVYYQEELLIYALVAGIIVSLLAVISPVLKATRLNIVEEIKFN